MEVAGDRLRVSEVTIEALVEVIDEGFTGDGSDCKIEPTWSSINTVVAAYESGLVPDGPKLAPVRDPRLSVVGLHAEAPPTLMVAVPDDCVSAFHRCSTLVQLVDVDQLPGEDKEFV